MKQIASRFAMLVAGIPADGVSQTAEVIITYVALTSVHDVLLTLWIAVDSGSRVAWC